MKNIKIQLSVLLSLLAFSPAVFSQELNLGASVDSSLTSTYFSRGKVKSEDKDGKPEQNNPVFQNTFKATAFDGFAAELALSNFVAGREVNGKKDGIDLTLSYGKAWDWVSVEGGYTQSAKYLGKKFEESGEVFATVTGGKEFDEWATPSMTNRLQVRENGFVAPTSWSAEVAATKSLEVANGHDVGIKLASDLSNENGFRIHDIRGEASYKFSMDDVLAKGFYVSPKVTYARVFANGDANPAQNVFFGGLHVGYAI